MKDTLEYRFRNYLEDEKLATLMIDVFSSNPIEVGLWAQEIENDITEPLKNRFTVYNRIDKTAKKFSFDKVIFNVEKWFEYSMQIFTINQLMHAYGVLCGLAFLIVLKSIVKDSFFEINSDNSEVLYAIWHLTEKKKLERISFDDLIKHLKELNLKNIEKNSVFKSLSELSEIGCVTFINEHYPIKLNEQIFVG